MTGLEGKVLSGERVESIIHYFRRHQEEIVSEWINHALIKKQDPFYEEVLKNGSRTLDLLNHYLETSDISLVESLTKKIAPERIKANTDISDFVYNITIGRQIMNKKALDLQLPPADKKWLVLMINQFFDQLLFHAIKEFSKLNEEIIKSKNQFIQEMHSDRLTILGQIAASFAHEFRNSLTSIKGFIYLLQMETARNEKADYYMSIMNVEMENLQDKISQFLLLSKGRGLDDLIEVFDLEACLKEMIDFMYPRFLEAKIVLSEELETQLFIEGDREQLKQVILNILNNAVEELCECSLTRRIGVKAYKSKGIITLEMTNNGPMIPPHLLENIFEPFITTKELGTGIGLSVCKQIVEKHNGWISVASDMEHTTFSIQFSETAPVLSS